MNQSVIALAQPKPIVFHPDLSDETMAKFTGVPTYTRDTIPFFGLADRVTQTPALKLRASDTPGAPGMWLIVDRLDEGQRIMLGEFTTRVRQSTGCREDDRDGAAAAFLAYVADKRARIAARLAPERLSLGAILLAYQEYLDSGAHTLAQAAVHAYQSQLVPVGEFFDRHPLGALTPLRLKDYEGWRRKQFVQRSRVKRRISKTEVGHEIGTLRQAVNWFQWRTPLNVRIVWRLPKRDTPSVVWWTRAEMARYLWACRGRIAVVTRDENGVALAWRWRIARDDDPSLSGPEGDRRVLRPAAEIERRKAVARHALIGVYTSSRGRVLIDTAWKETAQAAYVSFLEGQVRRKPIGAADTNKRRPPVALGAKIDGLFLNWAVGDAFPNRWRTKLASHVLHLPDGRRCTEWHLSALRGRVLKDCGVDKPLNALIMRHTAAMWMKLEGVSAWIIGEFLGCGEDVVVQRYGARDDHSQFQAADALCQGRKQKAAARRLGQAMARGAARRRDG